MQERWDPSSDVCPVGSHGGVQARWRGSHASVLSRWTLPNRTHFQDALGPTLRLHLLKRCNLKVGPLNRVFFHTRLNASKTPNSHRGGIMARTFALKGKHTNLSVPNGHNLYKRFIVSFRAHSDTIDICLTVLVYVFPPTVRPAGPGNDLVKMFCPFMAVLRCLCFPSASGCRAPITTPQQTAVSVCALPLARLPYSTPSKRVLQPTRHLRPRILFEPPGLEAVKYCQGFKHKAPNKSDQ